MAEIMTKKPEPATAPHEWRESEPTERPSRPAWMDPPAPKAAKAAKGGKS